MPELPEVETVRIGLATLLPGLAIKDVWHDSAKSFPNAPADVARFMVKAKILDVRRRAKVLIIDLSTNYSLIVHLKMTGQLVFVPLHKQNSEFRIQNSEKTDSQFSIPNSQSEARFGAGHPNDSLVGQLPDKTTHVILEFGDGSKLFFNDQRKFGWMRLLPTVEVPEIDLMKSFGPEPLEDDFKVDDFIERLMRRRNSLIKPVLLDQTVLAGVGNIYADESLFAAKIHPATPVYKIPKTKLVLLYSELRRILNLSIDKGGSTDRNYVDAEGKKGSYLGFAQVYHRQGKPCSRCGTEIIKTRVAGRGTHICPKCQRPPK